MNEGQNLISDEFFALTVSFAYRDNGTGWLEDDRGVTGGQMDAEELGSLHFAIIVDLHRVADGLLGTHGGYKGQRLIQSSEIAR